VKYPEEYRAAEKGKAWFEKRGSTWAGWNPSFAQIPEFRAMIPVRPGSDGGRAGVNPEFFLGKWCAMFINLARRQDRLANLTALLARQNSYLLDRLKRIDAVDGQTLQLDDPNLTRFATASALREAKEAKEKGTSTILHRDGELVYFDDHLTEGGIAAAMSHHIALQSIASDPTADWGLVLEDDITAVVPEVHKVIARILSKVPPNWDAIFLGYHGGTFRQWDVEDYSPQVVHMKNAWASVNGLYAWMVRKEAARAMLEKAFPVDGQVDHALSSWLVTQRGRAFRVERKSLLFYSPKSEDGLDSDIQVMEAAAPRWSDASFSDVRPSTFRGTKSLSLPDVDEIFNGFPDSEGVCPDLHAADTEAVIGVGAVGDAKFCMGMARHAAAQGHCQLLILGASANASATHASGAHLDCKKSLFKPSHSGAVGQSLLETAGHNTNLVWIDCAGCEWRWIDEMMNSSPAAFQRIHQLYINMSFPCNPDKKEEFIRQAALLHSIVRDDFHVVASPLAEQSGSDCHRVFLFVRRPNKLADH
jgi:GR25 family glycosyltransferase involved in LPS biosynthesis